MWVQYILKTINGNIFNLAGITLTLIEIMKPIIEKAANTILTKDITDSHFVGAIVDGEPYIIQKIEERYGTISLKIGDSANITWEHNTIKEVVRMCEGVCGVGVFNTYKELLEWLLKNSG